MLIPLSGDRTRLSKWDPCALLLTKMSLFYILWPWFLLLSQWKLKLLEILFLNNWIYRDIRFAKQRSTSIIYPSNHKITQNGPHFYCNVPSPHSLSRYLTQSSSKSGSLSSIKNLLRDFFMQGLVNWRSNKKATWNIFAYF